MDAFTKAYIEALLWSETDESTPQGGDPLDENYTPNDLDGDSFEKINKDCRRFKDLAGGLLAVAYRNPDYSVEFAGHDFCLTRNGHGAGFWDRNLGDLGDKLTDIAKTFPEMNAYAENGAVYVE